MVDFVTGTKTVFQQSTAPTGWTIDTTNNDCTLRVVSGTGGGLGGFSSFSSCMVNQSVTGTVNNTLSGTTGATTLDNTMLPSHTHTYRYLIPRPTYIVTGALPSPSGGVQNANSGTTPATAALPISPIGGGGSHSHPLSASFSFSGNPINFSVNYVDFIVATKN